MPLFAYTPYPLYHFLSLILGTALPHPGDIIFEWPITFSKISWNIRIPTIYNFAVIYPWNLLYFEKVAYFLAVSIICAAYKQNFRAQ